MPNHRRHLSLSTLTVAAVTAAVLGGPAHSAPEASQRAAPSGNLIKNPGAESTTPAPSSDGMDKVKLAHWRVPAKDHTTAVRYGSTGFLTKSSPGPAARHQNFFAGGATGKHAHATQTIHLTDYASWISSGHAHFKLAAWLGGFSSQDDRATVTVTWLSGTGSALGSAHVGPVTAQDRKAVSELIQRSVTGAVPQGSRTARVSLTMTRAQGTYNDGYADNLSLVLRRH